MLGTAGISMSTAQEQKFSVFPFNVVKYCILAFFLRFEHFTFNFLEKIMYKMTSHSCVTVLPICTSVQICLYFYFETDCQSLCDHGYIFIPFLSITLFEMWLRCAFHPELESIALPLASLLACDWRWAAVVSIIALLQCHQHRVKNLRLWLGRWLGWQTASLVSVMLWAPSQCSINGVQWDMLMISPLTLEVQGHPLLPMGLEVSLVREIYCCKKEGREQQLQQNLTSILPRWSFQNETVQSPDNIQHRYSSRACLYHQI